MIFIKPKHIRIINDNGYFRLKYKIDNLTILTSGFKTRKELAKVIAKDDFFKLDIKTEEDK